MNRDDDFRVRPGRGKSGGGQKLKPFVHQVMSAVERAGGRHGSRGRSSTYSSFGRGRSASLSASRQLTSRARRVTVKARVVRQSGTRGSLKTHLAYLGRDGVTRNGERGQLFDARGEEVDGATFAERCADDRHHFRFIVAPEDASDLADLKAFTRDLMQSSDRDLGTRLDWVAVDHWNTEHPHIHVLVRGAADDGSDLVISRDYIREGFRARAENLVTLELGPRSDRDVAQAIAREVEADRWTRLDQALMREAGQHDGVIDIRPDGANAADPCRLQKIGRLQKLEGLGLATETASGRWQLSETAEVTLRDLGIRDDIIKRMHRGLTDHGLALSVERYDLAGETGTAPIIGRLVARGLDDELTGTAFAIVDGIDGRTHHIRLSDLDASGDSTPGSIVELRRFEDAGGRQRAALATRSDLSLGQQIGATGATWLDRRLVAQDSSGLEDAGFGAEVRAAMDRRAGHLVVEGLARRQGQRLVLQRDLIDTLRQRELGAAAADLSRQTGLSEKPAASGDYVTGTYRQRLSLASGRFAMIDDGMGFQLVPWTLALEKHLGRHVTGTLRHDGGVDWSMGRKRGLGL